MCMIDYDYPKCYVETDRKARKQHVCYECRREIVKGENYRHVFAVYDYKPEIFKTCSYCLIAQDWLRKECNGFLHGQLEEEIEEHAMEYRKIGLYRWLSGIKNQWKNQWKWKLK